VNILAEQQNTPGWATYLRVSDEDKQTPERSFAMQRQRIKEQLLKPSNIPFFREYCDLLSGTNPNRKDYQQMLADADAGRFSHIGLYRADRFGRNTIEGLQAATKLISLGINIRVANMPSLRPEEPDGFFMFLIQMGLAQREVDVLAQRTADGMEAKLRNGGWPNKAPEGYVNKERNVGSNKYERWVEEDPKYIQPLREAWDLLLTDRYTLEQICEELTKKGYTRSFGRPWAWNDPKSGIRRTARNRLHEIFNHPFYAGWAVSERFDIKMGEVKGNWKPLVTTNEFERGKAILLKHGNNKSYFKRNHYLLRNLLWVQVGEKQYKLYGSTPTGRSRSYSYYNTLAEPDGYKHLFRTELVDKQIPGWIKRIAVNPELIPDVREVYKSQIKKLTHDDKAERINQLRRRIIILNEEEARLGRLVVSNKISESAYDQLLIEELEFDASRYLDDLEVALVLMANIASLFERLDEKLKTELLRIIVKRIIINTQGEIISHELHSPFTYLTTLVDQLFRINEEECGSEHVRHGSPSNHIVQCNDRGN
jgi:DNA invertase Pin-like site-specific DNA recombinase